MELKRTHLLFIVYSIPLSASENTNNILVQINDLYITAITPIIHIIDSDLGTRYLKVKIIYFCNEAN